MHPSFFSSQVYPGGASGQTAVDRRADRYDCGYRDCRTHAPSPVPAVAAAAVSELAQLDGSGRSPAMLAGVGSPPATRTSIAWLDQNERPLVPQDCQGLALRGVAASAGCSCTRCIRSNRTRPVYDCENPASLHLLDWVAPRSCRGALPAGHRTGTLRRRQCLGWLGIHFAS